MRYRIRPSVIVRTENSAQSVARKSDFLSRRIRNLTKVGATLDFGCGKLRYLDDIRKTTNELVLVDSEIQLARRQRIHGRDTSIREFASQFNDVTAFNPKEAAELDSFFDRGFCINMLSVVPSMSIRKKIVRFISCKLKPGGDCLFVVQYRNSEFKKMKERPGAEAYLDGTLFRGLRGYCFYGLIHPEALEQIVMEGGMLVTSSFRREGSAYILARNPV